MALYIQTSYYLVNNDKLNSKYSDFNNFSKNYDGDLPYLEAQSRHGWSATKILELLQASNKIGELSFLTEIRDSDDPYILLPLNLLPRIVIEIESLIAWCKENLDKLLKIFWYNYDNEKEIIRDINNTEFPPDEFNIDEDGDHPYFLFSYLRIIIHMIKHAERTKQSIVCITFM